MNTLERGRSMTEMLGVIVVMGVISIGALLSVNGISYLMRATELQTEVEEIANNIIELYSWSNTFPTGDITSDLCGDGIGAFPSACSANKGVSPWGGTITVTGTGSGFTITYNNVPEYICDKISPEQFTTIEDPTCAAGGNAIFKY